MPGAPTPFGIDQWAPPQYVYGGTGGAGPVRSPGDDMNSTASSQTYDPTITWKLAGTIVLALVTVFVLQASGFRFVGAASIGIGR